MLSSASKNTEIPSGAKSTTPLKTTAKYTPNLESLKKLPEKPKETDHEIMPHAPVVSEGTPHYQEGFGKEQVQGLLKYYSDYIREKHTVVAVALLREITLKDNFVVEIPISNSIEQDRIELLRPHLQKFLQNRLKNDQITVVWKRQEIDTPIIRPMVATVTEWDDLIAKFPLLEELKTKFNLEIE